MIEDLVSRVVWLCRALRERGLLVTTAHAGDAVRALQAGAVRSRDHTYLALRCVLASRPEDYPIFDEVFWRAFAPPSGEARRTDGGSATRRRPQEPRGPAHPSLSRWLQQGEEDSGDETEEVPGASDRSALVHKDFASFAAGDLDEIERIAARLARRLAARPGRRWKPARRGARVDLRRTVRRSLSTGAEPLDLRFRRRKPRKTRIVALCDVSGSMDLYSRLLLQFLYALHGSVARVESFAFSTSLLRITDSLRERPFSSALRGLSERDDVRSRVHRRQARRRDRAPRPPGEAGRGGELRWRGAGVRMERRNPGATTTTPPGCPAPQLTSTSTYSRALADETD